MQLRKRLVGKVLLGAVLIVLAGCVAFAVKDLLAYQRPESALPEVRISYNDSGLPGENSMLESYSWRFLTLTRDWQAAPGSIEGIPAAPVMGDAPLEINFSFEPKTTTVSVSRDGGEYTELQGELRTPTQPGEYTYHIAGEWGFRGNVNYYFKVWVV